MEDQNKTTEQPQSYDDLVKKVRDLESENKRLRAALSIMDKIENKCVKWSTSVTKSIEQHEYPDFFSRISKSFIALFIIFFGLGLIFTKEPLLFITFISLILTAVFSWSLFISIKHKFKGIEEELKELRSKNKIKEH